MTPTPVQAVVKGVHSEVKRTEKELKYISRKIAIKEEGFLTTAFYSVALSV